MSDSGWSSERLETAFEETRRVLDAQRQALADIDGKAMRTVRIAAVLLGVIGSVSRLSLVSVHPYLGTVGGGLLVLSMVVGVGTFNESDTFLGPSPEYFGRLVAGDFTDRTWEEDLVLTYGEFIEENADEIAGNSLLFRTQQTCFVLGLVALAAGVII